MDQLLSGKTILITGAVSGIGAAIAQRCTSAGAQVMIHGRTEAALAESRKQFGDQAGYVAADLEDPQAPRRIVEATLVRFQRLDGLVNCAALVTRSNLETSDQQTFDQMMAVNLRAPLFLIQAALPEFRRQGGGVVLNIGSVNAYCGEPNLLIYSLTKGALMTMTRNLADALAAERVRVNQLNVGWTLTEKELQVQRQQGAPEGWETQIPRAFAPAGRIFSPAEVAAHAVFWLSDAAGPVSGSVCEIEQLPLIGRNPNKT